MKYLNFLEEALIAFLMTGATLIIFVAVIHRYLSGYNIPGLQSWLLSLDLSWAQELCVIMFVWMAKFGAAYGVRTGIHVGVDVMVTRLEEKHRKIFILIALFAGMLFTGLVGTLGLELVSGMFHTEQVTSDMEIPVWITYLAIPLASYLMCFRFAQVAWTFIRTGEVPHHDHGHVDGLEDDDAKGQPA
ncbi:TRAP transporter small permease [Chitinimonas sp.]|uniref:TRAP transporter small permease n=1 Tax=Chitinimonas sp. TaxID=1934313 RepID=UPI002F92E162